MNGFTTVLNCSVFFTVSIIHTTRFEVAIFGRLGVDFKWTLISLGPVDMTFKIKRNRSC